MPDPTNPTIGYFTVVQDDRTGWTGGLLILNRGGRPVEFQCTLPVRPSRAHEILFGTTMRDHLIGEVIGPMLVTKCRTPLSLLCCDQIESLSLNSRGEVPVALVSEAAEGDEGPITSDMLTGSSQVTLVNATLHVPLERASAVETLAKHFEDMPDAIEPFERIREAIREAQSQIARAA
ncbi:hypothetical protein [Novipirellula sp.]|uniref:hypothetical protein n=1 Tax=Novipirellula sp. TaxID=2795430 RepID=UPI003567C596